MNNEKRLEKALEFIKEKHKGQYRKGGEPYYTHPMRVCEMARELSLDERYQLTALFHDLLEDTDTTDEEILALGTEEVLMAVKALTKSKGCSMREYVEGIKKNEIAYRIKGLDRLDNLRDAAKADEEFRERYIKESVEYYLDFNEEIPKMIKRLEKSLQKTLKFDTPCPKTAKEESKESFVILGDIYHTPTLKGAYTIKRGYIVCENGICRGVYESLPEKYKELPLKSYEGKLIIPGLVDLHIHAPQYAFRGMGMDKELMDWLASSTFPEEIKYESSEYAERAYGIFASDMKKSATTHAVIFATRHSAASEILMDKMEKSGLISYVGRVNMDMGAPKELCDKDAYFSAYDTISHINRTKCKYLYTKPILTPRFIPCCSNELLDELARIQEEYALPVQSHLSENIREVEYVKELCPKSKFYADAYDQKSLFGLVHNTGRSTKTIMAHCVHSSENEVELIKKRGVFVAHCPNSNINLSSGIAPIRKYLNEGLRVGLGTDVAGGHTPSVLNSVCSTVQASKLYFANEDRGCPALKFHEAFYLATMGGGEFFGKVGAFIDGYDFNCVVLDDSLIPAVREFSVEERVERSAYLSLDLFGVIGKYVNGREIKLN